MYPLRIQVKLPTRAIIHLSQADLGTLGLASHYPLVLLEPSCLHLCSFSGWSLFQSSPRAEPTMAPKGREILRPALPANILKQIGGPNEPARGGGPGRSRGPRPTRKELRKQERVQKRQRNAPLRTVVRKPHARPQKSAAIPQDDDEDDFDEDEEDEEDDEPVAPKQNGSSNGKKALALDSDGFSGFSSSDDDDESEDEHPRNPTVSKATKEKLAKEDAEIAELEKKLGIKKRKTLPKSFQEDGLEDLLGELADGDDDSEDTASKKKRKAEADEWLAQKRRKAMPQPVDESEEEDDDDDLDGLDDILDSESGNELDADEYDEEDGDSDEGGEDMGGDSDGNEAAEQPVRKRENPYVAPVVTTDSAQKYVPPARRQEVSSDAELLARIRRQTQGLINRLTESNLIAILGDIERLYGEHPRQHVTSILIDLVLVQICEPTSLPDTLLILYAGFSTAVYKVIGPDFGAQLIQHTVERFDNYNAQAAGKAPQDVSKHTSNLITFLAEIYNFQLIGCNLIFDYIRLLLDDLSEVHAELLLRIVRMAGQLLRHDDPLALKDIVTLIGPAVKKVGESHLSVRTKFMIETINDLKNNKIKAGASASAVIQDHTTRMKKLLGSLNSRKLKATEPLRIGLKDIEDSDKRGKWWLVGASWAGRDASSDKKQRTHQAAVNDESDDTDSSIVLSDDDEAIPDLVVLAREQNMNTDVRRSVFIAIMSASDYEDAYARVMKLRLNKGRQKEVAYVVMQCAGCEQQYNPYYSLIARRLCADRRIKFAFQDSLWKFFRRLGESTFGEDADEDEDDEEAVDVRRIFSLGKMFGFLIANGALGLSVLKCLNLAYLRPKTQNLVEVMLISMFVEAAQAGNDVGKMFATVADLPALAKGLQYFLKKKVQKSDLIASKKDARAVKKGCQTAVEALTLTTANPLAEA